MYCLFQCKVLSSYTTSLKPHFHIKLTIFLFLIISLYFYFDKLFYNHSTLNFVACVWKTHKEFQSGKCIKMNVTVFECTVHNKTFFHASLTCTIEDKLMSFHMSFRGWHGRDRLCCYFIASVLIYSDFIRERYGGNQSATSCSKSALWCMLHRLLCLLRSI